MAKSKLTPDDVDSLIERCKALIRDGEWYDQVFDHLSPYITTEKSFNEFQRRYREEVEPLLKEKK